ncbi:MAG: restriction endonuclease subunit S [Desulfamplus sp.]|nr:restriction endonuclease subunit S [Desulfamplus sp.]
MVNNMKIDKYPAYKDSGVEWLGEIPEHWEVSKLGVCLKPVSTKNRADLPLLSITRELGVIIRDIENEEENHNFIPDDLSGYKVIEKGQFGMNKMKAWQGSYGISPFTGIVSPAYYVFRIVSNIDPDYFHVAIRSKLYVPFFAQASDGVRIGQWDLSKSRMKEIPLIIPPLPEQTAIANFLDTKTAKIDQAISQKQKLIELLKERKQIIIQNAVTKGLDPNVKMKYSGVEWIGEIPEHWNIIPIKYLKSNVKNAFVDGPFGSNLKSEHFIENGEVYVIESGFITTGVFIRKAFKTISKSHFETIKRSSCKGGDVIIAKIGANYGMAAELPELYNEAVVSGNSLKITLNSEKILNSIFVKMLELAKILGGFEDIVNVSAQPALSLGCLNNLKLPISNNLYEQQSIVSHIENQSVKIDNAIDLQQKQIEKLKEYKTILINSAVTGKIKVS